MNYGAYGLKRIAGNEVYAQREWLIEFVNRLSVNRLCEHPGHAYWNHPDLPESARVQGFSLSYQSSDRYGHTIHLMISRSNTDHTLTLSEILGDLTSRLIEVPFKFGQYHKHLPDPGTYATIRFGTRWYMLSRSGIRRPYHTLIKTSKPSANQQSVTFAEFIGRQEES